MRRRSIPRVLIWSAASSVLAFFPTSAGGLVPVGRQSAFTVRHWTVDDGLPQNHISALAQGHDGYLWLGTWFGLARFDGVRFTVFNRYNTPALANDAISSLATAPDGALWIGTADGLVRSKDGAWTRYTTKDGLPESAVWDLAFDHVGALWVDTGDRAGPFPKGPFPEIHDQVWSRAPSRKLVQLPDGGIAKLLPRGLLPMRGRASPSVTPIPTAWLPDADAQSAVSDGKGGWWFGTMQGLWSWDAEGMWRPLPAGGAQTLRVPLLSCDKHGTLWAALGEHGLWRWNGSQLVQFDLAPGATEPDVTAILEDREESLWVGSDAGLYRLRPRSIDVFTRADGLPDNEIWSVSEDPDSRIWLATRSGLGCLDQTSNPQPRRSIPADAARRCVVADRNGTVWTDADGARGLYELPRDGSAKMHLEGEAIHALFLAHDRSLWVGTSRGGHCFRDGVEQRLANLPTNDVRAIYQTCDGGLWFGTGGYGAQRWLAGKLQTFTTAEGLADDHVFAFHQDPDGFLWIGTHNGLTRLTLASSPRTGAEGQSRPPAQGSATTLGVVSMFRFTTAHGLLDNLINHILEDDEGFLWFSCNRGIFRISRAELNSVAEGRQTEAACAVFGSSDGMLNAETNGEHQPAGCKARDGRLWFPTMMGVVRLDPRLADRREVPPQPVIEQVKADGQIVFGDGLPPTARHTASVVRLPPGRARVLQIRYTANSFISPEKVRFKWMLEGYDTDWRGADSNDRVAFYPNLRPGSYHFHLRAANSHGVWDERAAEFSLLLAPFFWQTWWFLALSAAGLIGLIASILAYRLGWQRRLLNAEHRQALADERTRIARDLHDDLGTALTGLALELDVIRRATPDPSSPADRLAQAAHRTRRMAERMREVVWAVNPRCDNVPSLAGFLEQQASQFINGDTLRFRIEFPEEIPRLAVDGEIRHQLALGVREALTNVVRHAKATEVVLSLALEAHDLVIAVRDNGTGCNGICLRDTNHGLANLHARMKHLGGDFACVSSPGEGTTVTFRVPICPAKATP